MHTSVLQYTEQDWAKLKRVMQFLNRTLDDYMIIGADSLTVLKTWVDASYGVHPDMKSHTGGVISLGRGVIMSKSSKQKLNTKSSTEAELVGASDYLPSTIWAKMFLEEQGYEIRENSFFQDNQSAMKLEKNGRASCGQKSRHIDIRYFFMKDRIKSENIEIVYCPTEQMLADFFMKPLQGSLFEKFHQVLMGHAHINSLPPLPLVPTEERVEANENKTTGKNEQCHQDMDVTDDVTTGPDADWTLVTRRSRTVTGRSRTVTGRSRTHSRGSVLATKTNVRRVSFNKHISEKSSDNKVTKRKDHSFV
jgi:hypothetical protein